MTKKAQIVALSAGLAVVLVIGVVFFLVTKNGSDDAGQAAPTAPSVGSTTAPTTLSTASSTTPPATSSTTKAPPSTSALKPIKCGKVATKTIHGGSLQGLTPLVRGIHDAACHRDYAALSRYMEDRFGDSSKKTVVAGWKRHNADGTVLQSIVETLENPPSEDQGGWTFCSPDGAVLIIARGYPASPGVWSDFDPTGDRLPVSC